MSNLCLFLRAPNLGQVKTRLAASIGEREALAAHIRLVDHAIAQLSPAVRPNDFPELALWFADTAADAMANQQMQRWRQSCKQWQQQQGDDLGARMFYTLRQCLAQHSYGIIVGADCPTVDVAYVQQAVSALLAGADVVVGPAIDGGYGLIGVSRETPEIFADMPWGSDKVLAQTLSRAAKAKHQLVQLAPLWDVDEAPDWSRFCAEFTL